MTQFGFKLGDYLIPVLDGKYRCISGIHLIFILQEWLQIGQRPKISASLAAGCKLGKGAVSPIAGYKLGKGPKFQPAQLLDVNQEKVQ